MKIEIDTTWHFIDFPETGERWKMSITFQEKILEAILTAKQYDNTFDDHAADFKGKTTKARYEAAKAIHLKSQAFRFGG